MGASFTCLASRQQKCEEYGSSVATLSPAHSLRRRSRSSSEQRAVGCTLQDVAINAVTTAVSRGSLATKQLSVLPIDLLQLVLDKLVQKDALTLGLLQGLITPWLHHLHLEGLSSVDDAWLPVLAGARHCHSLNISGAAVSDGGLSWLPWLWNLQQLHLQHCRDITDAGLEQVSELVRLRVLDVEGCEGLTSSCLPHLAPLTALTHLNMGQCSGLKGHKLHHIAGLRNLQHLSFGWCRSLGAVACDPSNNIQALASLTALTYLNLGGTQVCDAQLRLVLPHLTVLEELDLSRSPCTASGLAGMPGLCHSLRVLKLRGCQVSETGGAAALACLSRLRVLDLSCSSISSTGLLALAPLRHLHSLNLDMCHIGDEACRVFRALTSLECLDLSDTDITDEGVGQLRYCRRLERLGLCNTDAGDSSAASLAGLTRLTHLNFDSRGVTDACLPMLLPMGPTLRELDLSGGRITARGVALLARCFTGLEVLDLCGGHITDRACVELSQLVCLRELNLSQNRALSDAGLRQLASGLKDSLVNLNLSYTSVTDESIYTLSTMKALEVVVLSFSCVSESGAQRLRNARPKLLVKAWRKKLTGL